MNKSREISPETRAKVESFAFIVTAVIAAVVWYLDLLPK